MFWLTLSVLQRNPEDLFQRRFAQHSLADAVLEHGLHTAADGRGPNRLAVLSLHDQAASLRIHLEQLEHPETPPEAAPAAARAPFATEETEACQGIAASPQDALGLQDPDRGLEVRACLQRFEDRRLR